MKLLKQSTAATIVVGPVLDSSGAAVTTAVVGDFRIAKNGTTATLSGATVTHDANGYYTIALTTGNTDTVGRLVIYSGNTAHSMATHHWTVLLPSVFDALQSNATNAMGGLVTATAAVTAMAGAISTLTSGQVRTELATELGRIDATISSRMATYTQPTGFLAATFPATVSSYAGGAVASVTGAVGSVTSPVTVGTNNDKTGYSLSQAFPANFATLGINSSGHVSRVTLVDTTTTNTDMRGTDGAALASAWTATRAAYLDSVLLAANSNRTVQVTGSNHVAADIHELQTAVITADKFAANWLTAAGTAADYITELQTAIGTATNQTTTNDRLGYALAVLAGTISDAQTAAETYAITLGANTFTVDFSGLDSSGNRAGQTLTKV